MTDQAQLDFEAKKLQSIVKEKSYLISETGALADKISPGVLKSLVTLNDKPKWDARADYSVEPCCNANWVENGTVFLEETFLKHLGSLSSLFL